MKAGILLSIVAASLLVAAKPAPPAEPTSPGPPPSSAEQTTTAPPAAPTTTRDQRLRSWVDDYVALRHWKPEWVDVDGFAAEFERRAAAGEPLTPLRSWLLAELEADFLGFAPIDPEPGQRPYRLPFDTRTPRFVGQANGGPYSHADPWSFHAFDFIMPIGTPIVAARRGSVVRVVDGYTRCCLPREEGYAANEVMVLHKDGSFASYVHLKPGIPVEEGDHLQPGDLVGYSGHTGYSRYPHLHFVVSIRDSRTTQRSIPIEFKVGKGKTRVPQRGEFIGGSPPRNAELRVLADGIEVMEDRPVVREPGSHVKLRVHLAAGGGRFREVTAHPSTAYVALTPWRLQVGEAGRIVVAGDPIWTDLVHDGGGILRVLYDDPETKIRAWRDVLFLEPGVIEDP